MKRLLWLDVAKGLAILVVVYFHFFRTYFEHGVIPPADWHSFVSSATTILEYIWVKLSGLGFHAVGVSTALDAASLLKALDQLRVIKTPYEIACIDEANRLASFGHARVAEVFRIGELSELELHLLYLQATAQDVDHAFPCDPGGESGERCRAPQPPLGDRHR